MPFRTPHDAWKKIRKGRVPFPAEFVGHEKMWAKVADRLGLKPGQVLEQRAPVIGGRLRYHHRPLTSWRLPGSKGTLTLTTDEMEAKSWNRLKGKRSAYTPLIKDVFEVRFSDGAQFWAIHHENLTFPPPPDWLLFVDTFFRWRAMAKDALKPAVPEDLDTFLLWISKDEGAPQRRRRQEAAIPFKLRQKRNEKIDEVKSKISSDSSLHLKVKWAKAALKFLKANAVKHRDLDPSNLGVNLKVGQEAKTLAV